MLWLPIAKFKSLLSRRNKRRVWYNGRTSAFQADDAGSIPATRSKFEQTADMAQVVERTLGKGEVTSSNLVIGTIFYPEQSIVVLGLVMFRALP